MDGSGRMLLLDSAAVLPLLAARACVLRRALPHVASRERVSRDFGIDPNVAETSERAWRLEELFLWLAC